MTRHPHFLHVLTIDIITRFCSIVVRTTDVLIGQLCPPRDQENYRTETRQRRRTAEKASLFVSRLIKWNARVTALFNLKKISISIVYNYINLAAPFFLSSFLFWP